MNIISAYIKTNTRLVCIVLTLFLFLSIILAISIGPVYISFTDVWKIMFNKLFMYGDISSLNINTKNIVWYLRAPRVLLGMMVGACLTLSGVSMQTFTKNPLADPYILGISSGASCGAVISMLTSIFIFAGRYSIALGAFVGAIFSIFLVYYLSKTGREVTPIKLILVGVAVSAMFSAFTNYLVYNAPNDAQVKEATFWILGSLAGAKWEYLVPPAVVLVPSVIVMFCLSSPLNAMMMGDNTAITLGINIGFIRRVLIITTSLLTASAVAVSGCIGFVGLVIPHIIRALVGSNHRKVIPLSFLTGSTFMIWVDVAARMINAPQELPIGIITALIGAPFFLWLIKIRSYSFGVEP